MTTGCPPFLRPCCCWRGTCRVGLLCRVGGRRGRSTGVARSRPCGAAQQSCAGAGHLSRAGSQLCTASFCWRGWLVRCCDACRAVSKSEAALIDVRLDVGSLPPRSSQPTVTGCRLGGFSVGRDWWNGERIVGGVPSNDVNPQVRNLFHVGKIYLPFCLVH